MAESTTVPTNERSIMKKLRELVNAAPKDGAGWDNAWKQDVTPWDMGDIQPALRDLTNLSDLDLPRSGRALVPGCGRGYDAVFFASNLGLDTLGIDISNTAIKAANDFLASSTIPPPGKVAFEKADFFTMTVSEDQRYDLVYDYTFFVAIHPSMRNDWGRQINAVLKPGGFLITLVYPLDPETDTGPPFYVRPEHYIGPLGEGWQKVLDIVPTVSLPTHVGRERLVVWNKAE